MIGAGAGATVAGLIRSSTGGYQDAWLLAAALCLGAAAVVLTISKPRPVARKAAPGSHAWARTTAQTKVTLSRLSIS
ncbi:hypothetical protein ET989_02000 [Propioniciclava sinopodophylli]|uniref:MFS transporter n=1 Tax=Propioniciclava sinopodophylli TaxID=1837344 RepID=A0A4Q9KH90_9ACTN|nr:hypothetical protein [Propioniciclava sinopodophylli]TBT88729.1 hypothetical protein ET989_02000 [Propioniciclava sinopodophylli]